MVDYQTRRGDKDGTPNFHAFCVDQRPQASSRSQNASGDAYSKALGINDRGQIVGVSYSGRLPASSRAVIWQQRQD